MRRAARLARPHAGRRAPPPDRRAHAPPAVPDRHRAHGRGGAAQHRRVGRNRARHPQVERILCGHLHRPIDRRFAGTVAGTAPSTAHQIRLEPSAGATSLRYKLEPAGYQLHLWREDTGSSPTPPCSATGPAPSRCRAERQRRFRPSQLSVRAWLTSRHRSRRLARRRRRLIVEVAGDDAVAQIAQLRHVRCCSAASPAGSAGGSGSRTAG